MYFVDLYGSLYASMLKCIDYIFKIYSKSAENISLQELTEMKYFFDIPEIPTEFWPSLPGERGPRDENRKP